MLTTLLLAVLIGLVFLIWYHAMRAREMASQWAKHLCERRRFQWLDGSCTLKKIRIKYQYGRLAIYREYQFDYTNDSAIRCSARIGLLEQTLVWTQFDLPSRLNQTTPSKQSDSKIKHLDDYRD